MKFTKDTRFEDLPARYRGPFRKWVKYHNTPIEEVFWKKVNVQSPEKCWEYKGGRTADRFGYGLFYWRGAGKFRQSLAHRMAWRLTNGEIPDNLWVLHKCDNPPCCNPNHLFVGTPTDNMQDCAAKGRTYKPKGELSLSHKLTEAQVIHIRETYDPDTTSIPALAKSLNVTKCTVNSIVHNRTWKHVPWPNGIPVSKLTAKERRLLFAPKGENHCFSKLNSQKVKEIREKYEQGLSQGKLATQYGVTRSCIEGVVHRTHWKHVD